MKYKYIVNFSEDSSWYYRIEVGIFSTLKKAKHAANEYLKNNPLPKEKWHIDHGSCPRFEIVAEPEVGVQTIIYWKLPYQPGYKRWRINDDSKDLVTVVKYRNIDVNVYEDDYGQCYYLRWRNQENKIQEENCGSYNPDYEEVVRYCIDNMLDHIAGRNIFGPYYGTELRYIDPDHKQFELTHRMESVKIYDSADFSSKEEMIEQAKKDIDAYCHAPEYVQAEEERLKAIENGDTGKMYLHELINKMESEE